MSAPRLARDPPGRLFVLGRPTDIWYQSPPDNSRIPRVDAASDSEPLPAAMATWLNGSKQFGNAGKVSLRLLKRLVCCAYNIVDIPHAADWIASSACCTWGWLPSGSASWSDWWPLRHMYAFTNFSLSSSEGAPVEVSLLPARITDNADLPGAIYRYIYHSSHDRDQQQHMWGA